MAASRGLWAQQQQTSKPNVVFIIADDLGYADVSCYGRPEYKTPNIDRIAEEGMRFTQGYANSAVCSATRTALMTGRYQYRLPVGLEEPLGGPARGVGLPPGFSTLPALMKKAGYGTTLLGKWHLGYLPNYGPLKSGYDHFWGFRGGGVDYFTHKSGGANSDTADLWDDDKAVEVPGYMTTLLGQRAVKVITDYARARQPFYLSLHFNAPHWPWEGPNDEAESRRLTNGITDYDGGSLKTFGEMMKTLDEQVGNVLATLDREGIANNTIVIFTSDNGGERFSDTWPFSGHKTELLEGGLRIPMLVRWPGHIAPGSVSQQVTMTMDWLPTLVAAARGALDPATPPDGMNLLPAFGGAAPVARKVFWRYKYNSQRAMRDGDLKYLKIRDNTFLFNVVDDPLEKANLRTRRQQDYQLMVSEYETWVATMLPEDPHSSSAGMSAATTADRPGNGGPPAAAPGGNGAPAAAPAKQAKQ
jgi:arylsulfatase A-like enzyme